MRINKTTVTLTGDEIFRLFDLCNVDLSTMTEVQFKEYKKALKLLKNMKKQMYKHCKKMEDKNV